MSSQNYGSGLQGTADTLECYQLIPGRCTRKLNGASASPPNDPTSRNFNGQDDGEKFTMGDYNLDLEVIMVAIDGFEGI
ncbi:hypothetical protein ACHAP8_003719 [Fusarium lateritium]